MLFRDHGTPGKCLKQGADNSRRLWCTLSAIIKLYALEQYRKPRPATKLIHGQIVGKNGRHGPISSDSEAKLSKILNEIRNIEKIAQIGIEDTAIARSLILAA